MQVVTKGLEEANNKNSFQTSIDDDALSLIATLSGGYQHFIQQYAYSTFETDTDNVLNRNVVIQALIKENGALHQLGIRYLENWYTGEVFSYDYRTVLQILASNPSRHTTRKEILEKSGLKKHTVNNALTALKKKNIIIPRSGRRGEYRLPSQTFATWIRAFKIAAQDTEQGKKESLEERLNRHPYIRARLESLLAIVEDVQGDLDKANAAEQRVIEELRQMGNEVLHDWASNQEQEKGGSLKQDNTRGAPKE